MTEIIRQLLEVLLGGYVVWSCMRAPRRYHALTAAIARGEPDARRKMYQETIVFEVVSASLALLVLGPGALHRAAASLATAPFCLRFVALTRASDAMVGAGIGFVGAVTIVLFAQWIRARRASPAVARHPSRWRKLLPDFRALLPTNGGERAQFALVAIAAGVCEEIVFRGWVTSALHTHAGLGGTTLLIASAIVFGLAHAYQGVVGIVLTGYIGAVLAALFGATGSLVVPIVLHCLVDLRWVLTPTAEIARDYSTPSTTSP